MENINVQIYKLIDPVTNEVRYIGRTKNSLKLRLSGHIFKSKNKKTHKDCWIQKLVKNKLRPIIEHICFIEGWNESYKYEQNLIKEYIDNGFKLVNLHDRGEGCKQRNVSEKQKRKISRSVKLLHKKGLLSCGRVPLKMFDLDGVFIRNFKSIVECARFLKVSNKNLELSLKRKSRKFHKYQIRKLTDLDPIKYINPRYETNARLKQGELLENHNNDNQQPSLSSNTLEGSTTNSQVQTSNVEDGNTDTSALPGIKSTKSYLTIKNDWFNNSDDIV